MASTVETSQGKRRVRMPRPGHGSAVVTAPYRDRNGRFADGNDLQRLKLLKAAYSIGFVGLNPDKVVPWLRPFVELANGDASRLIEEAGAAGSPSLTGLAEQAANALAFARGLQAVAAEGDSKAQEQARHWMREYRQFVLALRAEARAPLRIPGHDEPDYAAIDAQADAETEARRVEERAARDGGAR